MIQRIDFNAIKLAAKCLELKGSFVEVDTITEHHMELESFLKEMHHLLFEVHVKEGFLVCPTTGRKFIIKDGIPNMLLHEDEI